ncbi:MAG: hypothetical protein U1E63_07150 [Burkholderiales bacterium]
MRNCAACAEPLPLDWPGYRRYCTGCYFARRDEQQAATDEAVEARIKEAVEAQRMEVYWYGFESGKQHAAAVAAEHYQRGVEEGRRSAGAVALDKKMVQMLLQLCHPDRHDGSAAATKATQWLLALRSELGDS